MQTPRGIGDNHLSYGKEQHFERVRTLRRDIQASRNVHLVVEYLALSSNSRWNQMLVQNLQNIVADVCEFGLDLIAIGLDLLDLGSVALGLLFLLNGRNDSPRSPTSTDNLPVQGQLPYSSFSRIQPYILVCHREQVALLDGQLNTKLYKQKSELCCIGSSVGLPDLGHILHVCYLCSEMDVSTQWCAETAVVRTISS